MLEKIVNWQKSRSDSYDFTKNSHCMIFDKKNDRNRKWTKILKTDSVFWSNILYFLK